MVTNSVFMSSSCILEWHHWQDTGTSQFVYVTYKLFLTVFMFLNLDSVLEIIKFS